jgi:predicted AAA+ superfamily ATPase
MTGIICSVTLPRMKLPFVNREVELRELDAAARRGGLLVLYGRRRIGKTRLLRHWLDRTGEFLKIVHPAACPPTYG